MLFAAHSAFLNTTLRVTLWFLVLRLEMSTEHQRHHHDHKLSHVGIS
jgi:hypothetical protein